MNQSPCRVHLILDPEFGGRLRKLPTEDHLWVIESPLNQPFIDDPKWSTTFASFTSFPIQEGQSLESLVIDYTDTIEDHHSEFAQETAYSVLHVVGVTLTESLSESLKSYEFTRFEKTPDGFVAYKENHT